jgi:two-component system cell cycle sensor histidine kinase/response regulator CckA
VHGILKSHHGAVTVRSEPGKGATFELYFPAAELTVAAEASGPPRPSDDPGAPVEMHARHV